MATRAITDNWRAQRFLDQWRKTLQDLGGDPSLLRLLERDLVEVANETADEVRREAATLCQRFGAYMVGHELLKPTRTYHAAQAQQQRPTLQIGEEEAQAG